MVELRSLEELRAGSEPPLSELLDKITEILRAGGVKGVVRAREDGGVMEGEDLLHALRVLGAVRAPVAEPGEKVGEVFHSLEELGFYDEVSGDPLKVYRSTLELLFKGWPTPLVRLSSLSKRGADVWAKLEFYNPFSNSVKDRIGWAMVMEAERAGRLEEMLYEATSTNTGIALAAMAALKGVRVKLYIPSKIQKVTDIYLNAMGAEVVRLPVSLTVEAIMDVERWAGEAGATHLNQFENDANFKVHLRYTAKELDYQVRSSGIKPTLIMGGLGTSGHMSAISFYFKNRFGNSIKIVGVQPAKDEVIPGIRRVESGMKWINWVTFDEVIDVKLGEALEEVLGVARSEGILIGLSAGAVVHAFKDIEHKGGDAILIFPDSGYKYFEQLDQYLSKRFGKG